MKKLLSLLLALTLLILPCAFAESAEDAEGAEPTEEIEVQLVEDSISGLRYNLPADWIVLSAAAIESLIAAGTETEEVESALSDELIAQVEALTQSGISMSMSADMLSNLNILVSPASGMTTQMLYDSKDVYMFIENDMMYTITFTNATPEVEEVMLGSIEVVPAEDAAEEEGATVETEESAAPEE